MCRPGKHCASKYTPQRRLVSNANKRVRRNELAAGRAREVGDAAGEQHYEELAEKAREDVKELLAHISEEDFPHSSPSQLSGVPDEDAKASSAVKKTTASSSPTSSAPSLPAGATMSPDGNFIVVPSTQERDLSYQEGHQPPNQEDYDDECATDASDLARVMPADVYEHPEWYGGGEDAETMAQLRAVRGNPDAMVTIYRGVPADRTSINKGDWVTLSREYATGHGESNLGGVEMHVLSAQVRAGDVFTDGDSLAEFGYNGPTHLDFIEPSTGSSEPGMSVPFAIQKPRATTLPVTSNGDYDIDGIGNASQAPLGQDVTVFTDRYVFDDEAPEDGGEVFRAEHPLVVRHGGSVVSDLARHYGVEEGEGLAEALRADGYDAVITKHASGSIGYVIGL